MIPLLPSVGLIGSVCLSSDARFIVCTFLMRSAMVPSFGFLVAMCIFAALANSIPQAEFRDHYNRVRNPKVPVVRRTSEEERISTDGRSRDGTTSTAYNNNDDLHREYDESGTTVGTSATRPPRDNDNVNASTEFVDKFWGPYVDDLPSAYDLIRYTNHVRILRWQTVKGNLISVMKQCASTGRAECDIQVSNFVKTRAMDYLMELNYSVTFLGTHESTHAKLKVKWGLP